MFKTQLTNILYTNVLLKHLLNIYKITQDTVVLLETVLYIYKIAQEMKVILEMFFKHP